MALNAPIPIMDLEAKTVRFPSHPVTEGEVAAPFNVAPTVEAAPPTVAGGFNFQHSRHPGTFLLYLGEGLVFL